MSGVCTTGHPMTPENTKVDKRGWKTCRSCNHIAQRRYAAKGRRGTSNPERFWRAVDRAGGPDACWPWTGSLKESGYGEVRWDGRNLGAHRIAYMLAFGDVPDGHHVDHACHNADRVCVGGRTCRHRGCVNPAHLTALMPADNTFASAWAPASINAAKVACMHGHAFTPENTYHDPQGRRACRACRRERYAAKRRRGA